MLLARSRVKAVANDFASRMPPPIAGNGHFASLEVAMSSVSRAQSAWCDSWPVCPAAVGLGNGRFRRERTFTALHRNDVCWSRAAGTGRSEPRDRDSIAERLLRVGTGMAVPSFIGRGMSLFVAKRYSARPGVSLRYKNNNGSRSWQAPRASTLPRFRSNSMRQHSNTAPAVGLAPCHDGRLRCGCFHIPAFDLASASTG